MFCNCDVEDNASSRTSAIYTTASIVSPFSFLCSLSLKLIENAALQPGRISELFTSAVLSISCG